MQKIDKIVWKETKYIAAWILIFSAILQAVFLVIGKWDYTVLLGNLLSAVASLANFLAMGIAVQKAVQKEDEKEAKQAMKASSMLRTFCMFVVLVIGVLAPCFHLLALIIPLIFPRIAIAMRPLWDKQKPSDKEEPKNEA